MYERIRRERLNKAFKRLNSAKKKNKKLDKEEMI